MIGYLFRDFFNKRRLAKPFRPTKEQFAEARLAAAQAQLEAAKAAYDAALDRGDTRAQGALWRPLFQAQTAKLLAERAL